jgi:lysophospholipase L1-like esterase
MPDFAGQCRARGVRSLAVFGDSITVGHAATAPGHRWADRLAAEVGATDLRNCGMSGTVMQASPLADGQPRPGSGVSRYRDVLLGENRCDAVAILYGYNDARYTAAPGTFGLAGFVRDYRLVIEGLLSGGYSPEGLCLGSPSAIPEAGLHMGSPGFAGQTRRGFETFVEAVAGLAGEYRTFYAPVYERMRAYGEERLASPDVTHPNDEGHRVIAIAFATAGRNVRVV